MMTPGSHTPWIEILGTSLLITLTGSYGTSVTDGRSAAHDSSRRSLESVPAVANFDGLVNRAAVETEFHHFVTARDAAKELCAAEPDNPKGYELLGDALVELGDYAVAASAYRQLQALTTD